MAGLSLGGVERRVVDNGHAKVLSPTPSSTLTRVRLGSTCHSRTHVRSTREDAQARVSPAKPENSCPKTLQPKTPKQKKKKKTPGHRSDLTVFAKARRGPPANVFWDFELSIPGFKIGMFALILTVLNKDYNVGGYDNPFLTKP